MPDDTTISAPIPVRVRAIPGGSRLMLDAFAQSVIEGVLDALLSTDRDSDLYERLVALAELTPDERALLPEHRLPYEELVADLAELAPKFTPLYGERGLDLAAVLTRNARRAGGGASVKPAGRWSVAVLEMWRTVKGAAGRAAAAVNGGAAA